MASILGNNEESSIVTSVHTYIDRQAVRDQTMTFRSYIIEIKFVHFIIAFDDHILVILFYGNLFVRNIYME